MTYIENESFLTPEDYGVTETDTPVVHDGDEREDKFILGVPEHEKTPEEEIRGWEVEINEEKIYKAKAIFEILEEKREEFKNKGKTPQIFLIKKGTLAEKCRLKNDKSYKEGFLEQDVLAIVNKKNPNRLNLIHSFSSKGENNYSFSYLIGDSSSKRYGEKAYNSFYPDKPIKNFSDKKNSKGDSLYIDISKTKDANELKELLKGRKVTSNNNFEYYIQPETKKNDGDQISIEELKIDTKIGKILVSSMTVKDEKQRIPKERKITVLSVDKNRLDLISPIKVNFDVICSIRKNIKTLTDKKIIEIDVEQMSDEELLSKLVLFQSEAKFHNLHVATGVFKGGILALPIKTTDLDDATTGEYLYVSNFSTENIKRINRSSTNYCNIFEDNIGFKTMKIGETFSAGNGQAVEIIKTNPKYDRSLINS